MASSSTSWMPHPTGKYPVNIGSSLGRAIKNRKLKDSPAPTAARPSTLPAKEFYSFKFNFKPQKIDSTKSAILDVKKGAETTQVAAEYPSTQAGEVYPFTGSEHKAKDVDCVLIYDEDTGLYTLEKVESFINLTSQRPKAASPRAPIGSPAAASTPASIASFKGKSSYATQDEDDDMDVVPRREEEEEPEEGEEIESPPRAVKPLPASRQSPKQAPPPPAPQPRAPPPAVKKASPPPPAPKPRPQPKPRKPKADVPPPAPISSKSYPDEEVFADVRPAKRIRPSPPPPPVSKPAPAPVRKRPVSPPPPPPPPISLSLPGSSGMFQPPPPALPVRAAAAPVAAPPIKLPAQPASPQMVASDSEDEDEDEWEQVSTTAQPAAVAALTNNLPVTAATTNILESTGMFADTTFEEIDGDALLEIDGDALFGDDGDVDADGDGDGDGDGEDGDGYEGEEIDADMLDAVLNETLEAEDSDEEDFVGAAVAEAADEPPPLRQPIMSLNRFADGGVLPSNDSDDDFSSSDSEDD